RPEITASVLRMYVNEARMLPKPLRWYYFSDCFRYERPQKGRYRQFWQFGVELIGAGTPAADAEIVMLAYELLEKTGVSFSLQVGHLSFVKALLAEIDPVDRRIIMAHLDKKDYRALEEFLSSKEKGDLLDSLTSLVGCRSLDEVFGITGEIAESTRIRETFSILDSMGIRYSINAGIARGLDYYTGLVFEGFAENLGAENQILGGGSYRLAHLFGGDDVPSCGFAIGFDRVMVALGDNVPLESEPKVSVLSMGNSRLWALEVCRSIRNAGIPAEIDLMGRGVAAQLSHASRNATFAAIVGDRETERRTVTLKNLSTGAQKETTIGDLIHEVTGCGSR
ncbi:MAG: histidine--tRNA ligase family protein, partial [Methanoregulaceae archaeon]|nr:histidine--tRNA ligase family protein [Methanoregulaceae archaeon]